MSIDWITRSQALQPSVRNFVDGTYCSGHSDAALKKWSPRDGRLLYRFKAAGAGEVDGAVAAARRAFEDGRWSKATVKARKDALYALASLVEKHVEELALLECLDVGKPISDALQFDIPIAAAILRYNAEAVDKFHGDVYAADHASLSYQLHRPIGVVAGIVGWNFPLVLAATKIGPALAMGNCLVLKPSELTSLAAARIAELALEAGVPAGVLNVIHGDSSTGAALAGHPDIDLVTFTGGSQTGKSLLMSSGRSNMKRMLLECGGKAPNIVFDDCPDLDYVADSIVARAFWNQGQVCTASSRLLIQDTIKDELLPRVVKRIAALRPADPLTSRAQFGALVSDGHKRKVLSYIEAGQRQGAERIYQCDALPPHEGGFYVGPVVLDGVRPEHTIAREEIFGPVLSVMSFRDEEEAIRIANSTLYGLSAIVWTRDLGRAHRATQRISAGWIVVNATCAPRGGPAEGVLPVSGHKESGIGTEGGLDGLEAYTSKTTVQLFV